MKKLLYKGIEFDDFQLYREAENSSGCEYGYPTDENLNTEGWEEADVYICPHCIKKYNLYAEAETDVETVEQYIYGEFDDGMHSMVCGVKGCNNGNSFDCCINIAGCQIEENEEHPMERDYHFAVTLCDGYMAKGTYTVRATTESEAHEKALTEICNKLYSALPELDIEVSVSLIEDFEMENSL